MSPRLLKITLATFLAAMLMSSPNLYAVDVTFVDEDFESYADNTALYSVWANDSNGTLVDETFVEFLTLDDIDPQDVGNRAFPTGGQGVHHFGGSVMVYQPTLNGGTPLAPSATQNIVLQADIFDVGVIGNKRMSVGLRSNAPANIVEIGHWNESPVELAGRTILFGQPTPTSAQPNWQFYELPTALDSDDEDTITTLGEVGEAWHTHKVTISPTEITFEIDLFRDGLNADTGLPGFDASMSFAVEPTSNGFNELRLGSPSAVTSGGNLFYGGVIFDNISLKLVDALVVAPLLGDYNGDLTVDAADYTVYRDTLGDSVTVGEGADGNENGVIDPGDYVIWVNNYGSSGLAASATSVPEPASLLALVTGIALLATGNRGAKR